jgi:hypothetical protein
MKPKQSLRRSSRFRRAFIEFFVAVTVISWGDIAMAQTKEQIETHNKAVVQASFDAWKAGTGQSLRLARTTQANHRRSLGGIEDLPE